MQQLDHFWNVWGKLKAALLGMDRVLLFAFLLAAALGLNGIRWGRVECWNRDQMALRELQSWGKPHTFTKPPLHTYINYALVTGPVTLAEKAGRLVTGKRQAYNEAKVFASRLVVLALFLGTIFFAYQTCLLYFNRFTARFAALVLATSAGFVAFNHFLSCDSPLLFFLMAAGYFAARINLYGKRLDYVLAGLLVGAAANTKYNGLAVGIALVAAHVLRPGLTWRERFYTRDLGVGLAMVLVGLFATNPYMVFEFKRFKADFMYNYAITPNYDGQAEGVYGYRKFLGAIPEIVGWPGAVLLGLFALGSLAVVAGRRVPRQAVSGFVVVASFVLLYFAKMGAFPRMETRFVLPVVPFAILLVGPLLCLAGKWPRWAAVGLGIPVLAYNLVCSVTVGNRFSADPRMTALDWMQENVKPGFVIESSGRSPHWWKMPSLKAREVDAVSPNWKNADGAEVIDYRMQRVTGRLEAFQRAFKGNRWVEEKVLRYEKATVGDIFTPEALRDRNPDVITVIADDLKVSEAAPAQYYRDLLAGKYSYKIALDLAAPKPPGWVYPREIDFLDSRTVLLVRQ
ncbi:MAG: glycosyltransferase family 39 protein [Chthoniobacteraceae bacterium]